MYVFSRVPFMKDFLDILCVLAFPFSITICSREFDSSTLPMSLSRIKTFYVTVTEELQLLKILEAKDHEDWCSSMY